MMKRKTPLIIAAFVLAFIVWGVRVYYVNAGVAKAYEIKTYQVNDRIPFDNAICNVTSFTYGKKEKKGSFVSVPLKINITVQNTSNKTLNITKVIEAKLSYGYDVYQTSPFEGDFNVNQLKNLSPNSSTKLTLLYHVKPSQKGQQAMLYFAQPLYGQLVMEKFKQGKRYGVGVKL